MAEIVLKGHRNILTILLLLLLFCSCCRCFLSSSNKNTVMADQPAFYLGDIIKETGDFGLFQVLLFAFTTFSLGVLNWSMMTMAFTASVPDWDCYGSSVLENNRTETWNASNVCDVNGTACDSVVFSEDMSTAVSEVCQ